MMTYFDMERFLNSNPNWREILKEKKVNVKEKENYVLFSYDIGANFSDEIVQMCRGSIFTQLDGFWTCVCAPFYKFGNYGESYVPKIDWKTASVQEKVDGSLIKVWYWCGWHVSTSGMIDAKDAPVANGLLSFRDLFNQACDTNELFAVLDVSKTYMFELVSPLNLLTVNYPHTELYLLGARDNVTFQEYQPEFLNPAILKFAKVPKRYKLASLEECIAATKLMTKDEEGFVVCDEYFNRIKVKSEAFLAAFHAINNGNVTVKDVLSAYFGRFLDDYTSVLRPAQKVMVEKIVDVVCEKMDRLDELKSNYTEHMEMPRADYAKLVNTDKTLSNVEKNFLFKVYTDRKYTVRRFALDTPISKWKDIVEEEIKGGRTE